MFNRNDHEWQTSIWNRVVKKTGCPVCSNHKIVKSNCLLTTYPELANQWHPTKKINININEVGIGSGKKFGGNVR